MVAARVSPTARSSKSVPGSKLSVLSPLTVTEPPPEIAAPVTERISVASGSLSLARTSIETAAFSAVGLWYEVFSQTSDDEVTGLLRDARRVGTTTRAPS